MTNAHSTTSAASADVSAGDVIVALASVAGTAASPKPAWIKIAPRGRITTRNGVPYGFDPEALAARFNADDTKVPVDFDHATVKLAALGQRADAIGWIEEMEARDDGLYGRVDWLETGKAALAARTHRYISPAFSPDQDGNAPWIHSVALTTAPALGNMPALAHAAHQSPQLQTDNAMSDKIAAALGLAAGTNETALLSAIADLRDGKVAKSVHDQTLATLSATTSELNELKAGQRKTTVDTLLDTALKEKRIVPAQRDAYAALCATDEGLAQITALLAATQPGLTPSSLGEKTVPGGDEKPAFDPVTLAANARIYLAAQEAAGNPISYIDAFNHVVGEAQKGAKS